jgi:hypothetical protein
MTEAPVEQAQPEKKARRKYRNETWTDEQVAARKAELSAEVAPEGWIKLSEVDKVCKVEKIPVSKLVRAIGGDRGMNPPLDPLFEVRFVGRTRYLHPDVMTKGLELLKSETFAKTARKPREKKEKVETGAVKGAKAEKTTKAPAPAKTKVSVKPSDVWEAK